MPFSSFQLDDRLLRVLTEQELSAPTAVQASALPPALAGRDVLVSAATGSGKTLAYLLPLAQRLLNGPRPAGIGALVLSPTRELAKQINREFGRLTRYTHLRSSLITGGADLAYQAAVLRKLPDLVVATPGRLLDHLGARNLDFDTLQVLVLDEADRVLEMGLGEDVRTIAKHCPTERQTLLFSATLTHRGLGPVREQLLREPEVIQIDPPRAIGAGIRQQAVLADDSGHKLRLLSWMVAQHTGERLLVFANTRQQVDAIERHLRHQSLTVAALHSERSQEERKKTLERFRNGRIAVLVATDVAARGLDIVGLECVINFDIPRSGDEYIHRVGRTGRAGSAGLAVSMVSAPEWNLFASIERYIGATAERLEVPGLKGKYEGPRKVKGSGKAAASGKRHKAEPDRPEPPKKKERLRDRKQIGKRRKPSGPKDAGPGAASEPGAAAPRSSVWDSAREVGYAPLRRSKPAQGPGASEKKAAPQPKVKRERGEPGQ